MTDICSSKFPVADTAHCELSCFVKVFLLVTWYAELSNDPKQHGWFAIHPLLQSFSIALITYGAYLSEIYPVHAEPFPLGILTLQPTSQPKTKAAGFARHHLAIFFIAFPSVTIGTFAVWYNKHLNGRDHFLSWHGVSIVCLFTADQALSVKYRL